MIWTRLTPTQVKSALRETAKWMPVISSGKPDICKCGATPEVLWLPEDRRISVQCPLCFDSTGDDYCDVDAAIAGWNRDQRLVEASFQKDKIT